MNPKSPAPASALHDLADDPSSRKTFLRMMGGTSAAAGLAGLLSACGGGGGEAVPTTAATGMGSSATSADGAPREGGGDVDIVNYALTLEYLEAMFYTEVEESGVVEDRRALELVKRFGETEQEHAETLKATVEDLGGTPVGRPRTRFRPVIDGGEEMVLQIAATIENLGASAYLGQAPNIENKDVLAAALAIHSVEARHAAALNRMVRRPFRGGSRLEGTVPDGAFAKPMTMEQVLAKAKPFLAT